MKLTLFFLFSILTLQSYSQKKSNIFSYYLESTSSPYKTIANFDENQFGNFTLLKGKTTPFNNYELRIEAGENLIIDEDGIYVLKNKILSISRTEIRENSKYRISNGYLHGVIKDDSLAVALKDELFYFLMPTKAYLFDSKNASQHLIEASANSFLVISKESNTYYSVLKIDITNTEITFSELDLNYEATKSITHNSIMENGIETFILTPTLNEWELILKNFVSIDSYSKLK